MFDRFVKTLAPGWFAAVMGTAVTGLALRLIAASDASRAPIAHVADFFHWTAIALFTVLTASLLLRLIRYPDLVWKTITHPVESSFLATFPIAMLVMAGEWTIAGMDRALIAPLWWTGTILVFLFSYVILFHLFTGEKLQLNMLTPGHFIPAVGLVVIPVAGAGLAGSATGVMREVYFGVNMMGFGAGVFMYVGLVALTMGRHYLGSPIVGKMTPTLWVHIAPLSVLPLSLLSLLHAAGDEHAFHYGSLIASAFLGAATWWLVLAIAMTVKNIRDGQMPFALPWWAFTFPIGAQTALAMRLADFMKLELLPYIGMSFAALLLFVWTAAAVGTLKALVTGKLIPKEGESAQH